MNDLIMNGFGERMLPLVALVVVVVVDSTRVDKRSRDAGPAGESWGERASFVMRCSDIMCEEKERYVGGKEKAEGAESNLQSTMNTLSRTSA